MSQSRVPFNRARPPLDVEGVRSASEACAATSSVSFTGGARVGPSTIKGAGYGLFARSRLARGELVVGASYSGDVLSLADALKLGDDDKEYVMAMHFNVHVDAKRHYGYLGRYVNDSEGTAFQRNVKFEKNVAERRATLRALRDIDAGEELFAEYGRGYWRRARNVK